jgi:phosphate transport system substrate-binding protein
MSKKSETPVLISSLLITLALLGGGIWWFSRRPGVEINLPVTNTPNSNTSNTNKPNSSPSVNNQGTSADGMGAKTFVSVQNVPTGLFNYGGSTSWAPLRLSVDSAIQSARPEFRLRYVQPINNVPSSTSGIKSLIEGELSFAQSSRPINEQEINAAKQRGFTLKQIAIAIDGLAVAVNPTLNIAGLTIEDLKSIYTGKVTNWSQVGGPNLPIRAYSRKITDGGTVELFVQEVLGGQAFAQNVEFISTTTQALQKLANSPGGIYYASAPEVVPQCSIKPLPLGRSQGQFVTPYQEPSILPADCPSKRNKLNIEAFQSGKYPITRNLFVVVKQNGQAEQQAGDAYANLLLTEQGQELISQAGFVKIR